MDIKQKVDKVEQEVKQEVTLDVDETLKRPSFKEFPRTLLRGVGQVMFQDNMWTGILFLCGIIWGAYMEGQGLVCWGCIAGVFVSTMTGYILKLPDQGGAP